METKTLGLYLHFPFCLRKCNYCDFLSAPADEDTKRLYARALVREIRAYGALAGRIPVSSVFLGGGTPSCMPGESLAAVMKAVHETFAVLPDAEITMEMNPAALAEPLLSFIFHYVNRVSIGLQSASDRELKTLGRLHSYADFLECYKRLRQTGVRNINIDLMSAVPGQTLMSWKNTLTAAADLKPEHISAYSLIVEEGTPFFDLRKAGKLDLPDEETERQMYYLTEELLRLRGYARYEISNYARKGFECRHNLRYWRREDYLGFGIGAASLFQHARWKNTENLELYLQKSAFPGEIVRDMEELTQKSEIEEFMFLGLRTTDGVTEEEFFRSFALDMKEIYGEILERLIKENLLAVSGTRYYLTGRGTDISNKVLSEFLL